MEADVELDLSSLPAADRAVLAAHPQLTSRCIACTPERVIEITLTPEELASGKVDRVIALEVDGWGSHLQLLKAAVDRTTGPILEIGAGDYSTPYLHEIAKTGRVVVTAEPPGEWLVRFDHLEAATHMFVPTLEHALSKKRRYDVALVDGGDRAAAVRALRGRCRYVVVHDTDPQHHYEGLAEAMAEWPYRRDDKRVVPWTSVLSEEPF